MTVNNISLAIGQKWKTRGGNEVEIVGYDEKTNTDYVWNLSPEGSVTDDGYCLSAYSTSVYDLITPIQDEHGFIPWNGGECPVSSNTLVEYKMRDYGDDVDVAAAKSLRWNNSDSSTDIIAYRVVKQEVKPTKVDFEEEQKYTIKQVFEAINRVTTGTVHMDEIDLVEKELAKTQDPEYKLYLELKAKFE